MSAKSKPWLPVALCAHQAHMSDQLQRVRSAIGELQQAQRDAAQSAQALVELGEYWSQQRRAAVLDQQFDAACQSFHCHLRQASANARDRRQIAQSDVDKAVADLKKSHAVMHTLERVAFEMAQALQRATREKQLQLATESWLLRGAVQPSTKGLGQSCDANPFPQPMSSGAYRPTTLAGQTSERHESVLHDIDSP